MTPYYMNQNPQPQSGDYEVHRMGCPTPAAPENQIHLGAFASCHPAVAEAKTPMAAPGSEDQRVRSLFASLPHNLIAPQLYSRRYRAPLPDSIRQTAPTGREWAIFPGGKALYTFRTVPFNFIEPRQGLRTIQLPDATPGVISKYSLTDEQALLARVRYNRLLDVFTGLACYPLQSHLRTSITITNAIDGMPSSSQVETDDVYVGLDEHGAHYILPVQAKGGSDSLSVVQIWQDLRVAQQKFPDLIARPVAASIHGAERHSPLRSSKNPTTRSPSPASTTTASFHPTNLTLLSWPPIGPRRNAPQPDPERNLTVRGSLASSRLVLPYVSSGVSPNWPGAARRRKPQRKSRRGRPDQIRDGPLGSSGSLCYRQPLALKPIITKPSGKVLSSKASRSGLP